jgi:nitrogen fixation protein FixH
VVVALGQAGVLTMTVEMVREWLHRDRKRSLEIEWTEGEETHRVTVRGDAIDTATLRPVAEAAAARIGEGAWARSATAPS